MTFISDLPIQNKSIMSTFCEDVISDLSTEPKRLNSKYFYDAKGDLLFQKIMNCPEYYLSRCELDILKNQAHSIASKLIESFQEFDLIELGPGDASKSIHLLQALQRTGAHFSYVPIDISVNIINRLEEKIPAQVKGLNVQGLAGEYLEALSEFSKKSKLPKIILFLGANLGNLDAKDALAFCKTIEALLNLNDLLLIGFDLRKKPDRILVAYNDRGGITKAFNLNLLTRINRELEANFDLDAFEHFPTYDPLSGICKSFLISEKEQIVYIKKANTTISFSENEPIFMEMSMKYSIKETEKLAREASFSVEKHFFDRKKWFIDSIWKKTNTL